MLVVCFTTIPSRINVSIEHVNKVISKQTRKPDKIFLFLPIYSTKENCNYKIPKNTYNIEIIRCDDYGPGTKLYPVVFQNIDYDAKIITIDDDINYEKNCFELLEKYSDLYPRRVLSGSGWIIGDNIFNCFGKVRNIDTLKQVDIIQGYSSCLYRKWMIEKDIVKKLQELQEKDYSIMIKNDDIWISGYLDSKRIRKFVIPKYYFKDTNISYINGISNNLFSYLYHCYLCIKYFKKKNYFNAEQTSSIFIRIGTYIFILFFIITFYFAKKSWK